MLMGWPHLSVAAAVGGVGRVLPRTDSLIQTDLVLQHQGPACRIGYSTRFAFAHRAMDGMLWETFNQRIQSETCVE